MTNLLKLRESSYYEYSKYKLNNAEIEELREICYGYGTCLPLAEFFNDIGWNKEKNFNKNQAYKDLAYLVQYIEELHKESKILAIFKKRLEHYDSYYKNPGDWSREGFRFIIESDDIWLNEENRKQYIEDFNKIKEWYLKEGKNVI